MNVNFNIALAIFVD
jgi:hypothetical protein